MFGSLKVRGLYDPLFAEAWPVELHPGRFRSDEARMRVLARTAGILGDLEAAIRHELGADRMPPMTGPALWDAQERANRRDLRGSRSSA